ncbi:hypothetical protein GQ53DRAFT_814390 [Thozetella sp. PMI_491]|nr:hypothetical protein GQ53DRAFT_814390 [Thozetella sp. PMI_491]
MNPPSRCAHECKKEDSHPQSGFCVQHQKCIRYRWEEARTATGDDAFEFLAATFGDGWCVKQAVGRGQTCAEHKCGAEVCAAMKHHGCRKQGRRISGSDGITYNQDHRCINNGCQLPPSDGDVAVYPEAALPNSGHYLLCIRPGTMDARVHPGSFGNGTMVPEMHPWNYGKTYGGILVWPGYVAVGELGSMPQYMVSSNLPCTRS